MKRNIIISILFIMLMFGAVYAKRASWKKEVQPPISLEEAIQIAKKELSNRKIQYYCIGASLARTFTSGDWELHYSSKGGQQIWLSIGSNKKARVSKDGFEY